MRPTLLVSCAATALLIGVAGANAQAPEHKSAPGLAKESPAAAGHQAKPSTSPDHGMAEHRSAAQDTSKAGKDSPKADAMSPANELKSHQGAANDKASKHEHGAANDKGPTTHQRAANDKASPNARQGANDKAGQQPKSAANGKSDAQHSAADAGKQPGDTATKTGRSAATGKPDASTSGKNASTSDRNDTNPSGKGDTTLSGRSATSTSSTADHTNTQSGITGHETNSSSTSVQIDAQKQERIRTALTSTKVENISHVDFNVSVGTRVPERYHFHPLPTEIVDIVPEYRGFDYMVVDNEIVIVNPRTREIVYTMSEGRSAGMNRPSVDCR
ncbi:MAG: DUF1236 domain-containing protein [Methylobacteriaceae bacterium]|nr:DUF1236 domain-containing protein [Methylobacteriaceae bacterium]